MLTGVLRPWLEATARFEVKGKGHPVSGANLGEALRRLTNEPFDGLVRTNEKIYHLLTLGTSLDQAVDGDRKGHQLHFVDWKNGRNNVFHVTDEFVVERTRSHDTTRPDLVLFVNGIPLAVIECKRRDKDKGAGEKQVDVAIEQMLRNQRPDYIPHLFQYAQLLVGTSVNEIRYGTVGTPKKFWSVWKEEGDAEAMEAAVTRAANMVPSIEIRNRLFTPLAEKEAAALAEEMALAIQGIIDGRKRRDWPTMGDVIKDIQNDLDDYLFDLERTHGVRLTTEQMDAIIERCLAVARKLAGHGV